MGRITQLVRTYRLRFPKHFLLHLISLGTNGEVKGCVSVESVQKFMSPSDFIRNKLAHGFDKPTRAIPDWQPDKELFGWNLTNPQIFECPLQYKGTRQAQITIKLNIIHSNILVYLNSASINTRQHCIIYSKCNIFRLDRSNAHCAICSSREPPPRVYSSHL